IWIFEIANFEIKYEEWKEEQKVLAIHHTNCIEVTENILDQIQAIEVKGPKIDIEKARKVFDEQRAYESKILISNMVQNKSFTSVLQNNEEVKLLSTKFNKKGKLVEKQSNHQTKLGMVDYEE